MSNDSDSQSAPPRRKGILLAAGAGAWSDNTVENDIEAYIQNNATVTASGGNITVTAADNPTITANGGGVGIAVGAAGGAGKGLPRMSPALPDRSDSPPRRRSRRPAAT